MDDTDIKSYDTSTLLVYLVEAVRTGEYHIDLALRMKDMPEFFANSLRVINENLQKWKITKELLQSLCKKLITDIHKHGNFIRGQACVFKALCNIEELPHDIGLTSIFLSEFLFNEEEANKALSYGIPSSFKQIIKSLRFIKHCFELIQAECNNIKRPYFYELLSVYGKLLKSGTDLNVEYCFKVIIKFLSFLIKTNTYNKYHIIINEKYTTIGGYIFNTIENITPTGRKDLANGLFKLIRFMNAHDENFDKAFEECYTEHPSHIRKLCGEHDISAFFEDHDLDSEEDDEEDEEDSLEDMFDKIEEEDDEEKSVRHKSKFSDARDIFGLEGVSPTPMLDHDAATPRKKNNKM